MLSSTLADPQGRHCVWDAAPKARCVEYHTHTDSESSACVLAQTQTPRSNTRCTGTDSDAPGPSLAGQRILSRTDSDGGSASKTGKSVRANLSHTADGGGGGCHCHPKGRGHCQRPLGSSPGQPARGQSGPCRPQAVRLGLHTHVEPYTEAWRSWRRSSWSVRGF